MKEFDFDNKPIVDIANEVILDGVKRGASDIHFDPFEEDLVIRFRIDGVLYDYAKVPPTHKRNMISRIKMIASMNIMETRLPQDGAIKSRIGGKDIDLRVSSLPTYNGEKVVLRILDYTKSLQGLETLGFSKHNYEKIIKMTEIPNGIILVTGATGSGKSTTVYSVLQKLNTRDVNIITVEDPVEMDIEGLNQVQAQEEIGLDFATVLRSILRQDPDIIMIGEIRDTETARIAVRASITGHKVLSTIHTNNALNTIERLTDMDVERYLIGTSLNGIISQKLARKLCPHCRILRETNEYEKKLFKTVLRQDVNKIYELNTEGCEHCFKGYKDRTAIAEVLLINDAVRTAITTSAPKDEMRKLVYIYGGTHTLLEDGLEKVRDGETSFQELYKLVDIENDLAVHETFHDEYIKYDKEKNGEKDEPIKDEKPVHDTPTEDKEIKEEPKEENVPKEQPKVEESLPKEENVPKEQPKLEESLPKEEPKITKQPENVEEEKEIEIKIEEPKEEVLVEEVKPEEKVETPKTITKPKKKESKFGKNNIKLESFEILDEDTSSKVDEAPLLDLNNKEEIIELEETPKANLKNKEKKEEIVELSETQSLNLNNKDKKDEIVELNETPILNLNKKDNKEEIVELNETPILNLNKKDNKEEIVELNETPILNLNKKDNKEEIVELDETQFLNLNTKNNRSNKSNKNKKDTLVIGNSVINLNPDENIEGVIDTADTPIDLNNSDDVIEIKDAPILDLNNVKEEKDAIVEIQENPTENTKGKKKKKKSDSTEIISFKTLDAIGALTTPPY